MDSANESEFEPLKTLLLEMAQERSLDALLEMVVKGLTARTDVALSRLWLKRPGDLCSTCRMRDECPDQSACLHLTASAGNSLHGDDWTKTNGRFRRFPVGVRKVGHIAASQESILVKDIEEDSQWIADSEWAKRESVRGFEGQPLIYKGEVLGVLAVFRRSGARCEGLVWLRMIADHAAAAIANSAAFERIEKLQQQLELENAYLKEEVRDANAFGEMVGRSAALGQISEQIDLVAPTDANVLILGESGTGKELVAREIHRRSDRNDQAMVKVNCASVPKELFESEFFGHVKGAFTGAVKDRGGRFELADGGTLFLDEVGEIPLELQSKLLRVLQEGQFERVGDDKLRNVDVRIVAATNRDLRQEVAEGRFREDLYYRLNVFPIQVAPLRDRCEDVPLLAEHFLDVARTKLKREDLRLTQADVLQLREYDWPGNIRELQNVIERAVILTKSGKLRFDLAGVKSVGHSCGSDDSMPVVAATASAEPERVRTEAEMKQIERDNIVAALDASDWTIKKAAEMLEISPTTLSSRVKKLGLKRG
ncbi:MAG: sigma 54-interacting transcriptional regulator [Planctomycetota bacterium]